MKKLTVLIPFLFLSLAGALAQDKIVDQFKLFAANKTQERVYLHLNQHYAQPGARLWLNAYVFDDGVQKLSEGSKVLYLNVVDQQGEVVLEEKIPLNAGVGEGYIDVPADFEKGLYIIRAYTGWMRNFGTEHFFRDWLWVNQQPGELTLTSDQVPTLDELKVSITPEANMAPVGGLTTRFTVNAYNDFGKGAALDGQVLDEAGTSIASFTTNEFGYGAFIMNPEEGKSYTVVLKGVGPETVAHPFPEVKEEGVAMLLTVQPSVVRASFQSKWVNTSPQKLRLLLQSKGTIYLDQDLDFTTQLSQALSIPAASLKQGVYQLSLLDSAGNEMGQRVFQIYPDQKEIELGMTESVFRRGDKVRVNIPQTTVAAYSVSISDQMLEGNYQAPTIDEAFYMSDPLSPRAIEILHFYDKAFKRKENWDLYLLTKRLDSYAWDEIMNYKAAYPKWPYEKYISAYGQVRTADSLLLGEELFTFYSFAHQEIIPARTDEKGWFLLPVFDFSGPAKIVGLSDNKAISFSEMKIDVESGLPATDIEKEMMRTVALAGRSFSDQRKDKLVFKSSYKKLTPALYPERQEIEVSRDFSPFTRNTDDYQLDLRQYLSFSSLREVIIEIGRGITIKERDGKKVIMMYNSAREVPFPEPALIFINGIPTIDYELVLTLDPEVIETIKLYRSATAQERFGAMARNGIISISTKDKALEIPNQENISFTFEGFQPKEEFSNASIAQLQTHLPDFRHQLYWRTGTNLPSYIECSSSDILSMYKVSLVTISADGQVKIGSADFSTLPVEVADN